MSPRTAPGPLLLATEHTEQDAGAEAVALALAHHRGEPLAVVLPVARDAELEMAAPAAAERADAEAAGRREALGARAQAAGVVLDLRLRRGPQSHAEILDEARARHAGLLVIRRRGRRGLLARLLVGEMVSRVLAQAPCSVLVVPREARLWRRAVLVAVDPQGREPSLPAVGAALAHECGAALHLVCVAGREEGRAEAERALAQALVDAADAGGAAEPGRAPARGEVRVGPASAEIMAAARSCGADLLVVGRQGGGHAPARGRLGSVAREVTGLADCPVLVHLPPPPPDPGP